MEKVIKSLTGGYTCRYNDEGILCLQESESKNINIFFPYGSITKIKLGFFGLDVVSKDQSFYMPVSGKTKAEVKEMVAFVQNKMKNAAPATAVVGNNAPFKQPNSNAHDMERRFYEACQKAGISLSPASPTSDRMRAVLIAEQNNLRICETDVVEFYQTGKNAAKQFGQQQKHREMFDRAKRMEKFLAYHGRDLEVKITGDMLNYYKQQQEAILSGRDIPQRQELDWAIMGGIASAIAGGAAGVAVASDIQAKNAEIRAQNAQVRSVYTRAMLPKLDKLREKIDQWSKIHDKAKIALVDDREPAELFQKITISDEGVFVLDDGNFVVKAEALIRDVTIYGDVPARIDGSLTAMVYQDGKLVGEAPVILPREADSLDKTWINRRQATIIGGSIRRCAEVGKPCEVQFKYRDLWAVEKI